MQVDTADCPAMSNPRCRSDLWYLGQLFAAICALLLSAPAMAQGMILNELSNGPSGAKEFFELLVIGSQASPTNPVNLQGWIIDDNNGEWGGSSTGVGIAPGHVRINTAGAGCGSLAAVNPGSIIVIYNGSDVHPGIPGEDTADANADGVYFVNAEGACVTTYNGAPTSSSTAYSLSTPAAPNYGVLALANAGDAGQVRKPDASLFHGFAFGTIPAAPVPAGSFNVSTSSGTASAYIFSCGSWNAQSNFTRIASSIDTPGTANNAQNVIFRNRIQAGSFDYANPANPANCSSAATIAAVSDSVTGINGLVGAAAVVNAFSGDTINGAAASTSNAVLNLASGSTVPAVLTFTAATGAVDVTSGTAAGTYGFNYQICEKLNPANCKTAAISVTVVAAAITADADTAGGISGVTGGVNVVDVLAGDTLNGAQVLLPQISLTVVVAATPLDAGNPVPLLDTMTGQVSIPAGTPTGTYTITYKICEKLNLANCASNTATIILAPTSDVAISKSNFATNIVSGSMTTYTLTVVNHGPDSVTGVIVKDTPGSGLTCMSGDPVAAIGSGVPAGSLSIGDLTGAGIALGTLDAGQSVALTYSCKVK